LTFAYISLIAYVCRLFCWLISAVLCQSSPISGHIGTTKDGLRRALRTGALSVLSASSFLLLAQASAKWSQSEFIKIQHRPVFEIIALAILISCVAILFFHHRKELRNRHSELVLAECVWQFMIRRGFSSQDECISTAVRLFSEIYARFGIVHASVALPVNGELVINPKHVFPKENRRSFYQRLSLHDAASGSGVAGRVFYDGMPRYVPRLFYPFNGFKRRFSLFFPHAIVFEITKTKGRFELVNPKLDFDVFETSFGDPFVFKSFVSVPLRPIEHAASIGVLNLDFQTTDPLARNHIKTAVVLALILADELERIRLKSSTA
jgi:hypothetical protein